MKMDSADRVGIGGCPGKKGAKLRSGGVGRRLVSGAAKLKGCRYGGPHLGRRRGGRNIKGIEGLKRIRFVGKKLGEENQPALHHSKHFNF